MFGFAYWHSGNRVTHGTVGVDRPIRIEEFIVDWLPELDDAELHSVIRENLFAKDVCGGSHFACDLDEDSVSRL